MSPEQQLPPCRMCGEDRRSHSTGALWCPNPPGGWSLTSYEATGMDITDPEHGLESRPESTPPGGNEVAERIAAWIESEDGYTTGVEGGNAAIAAHIRALGATEVAPGPRPATPTPSTDTPHPADHAPDTAPRARAASRDAHTPHTAEDRAAMGTHVRSSGKDATGETP